MVKSLFGVIFLAFLFAWYNKYEAVSNFRHRNHSAL